MHAGRPAGERLERPFAAGRRRAVRARSKGVTACVNGLRTHKILRLTIIYTSTYQYSTLYHVVTPIDVSLSIVAKAICMHNELTHDLLPISYFDEFGTKGCLKMQIK